MKRQKIRDKVNANQMELSGEHRRAATSNDATQVQTSARPTCGTLTSPRPEIFPK